MAESVTITDNRTGESDRDPDRRTAASTPRQWSKLLPGRLVPRPVVRRPPPRPSSSITELDGEAGILRYRGLPDRAAGRAVDLPRGGLPAASTASCPPPEQFEVWKHDITYHTFIHENVRKRFMEGFHHDAHPMGILVSTVAALSTFYPEAKDIDDADVRYKQIIRLIAKMPTLAAGAYRHSVGHAVRLPGQQPRLRRELPVDDVEDRRAPLRAPTRCCPGPSTCCSSCTPTTSRTARTTAMRVVGSRPRRPVHRHRRGRRGPLRPPPRRRQRGRHQACSTRSARIDNVEAFVARRQGAARAGCRASATGSTRTTTPGPRSSRRPPTRSSRSPARTRCSTSPSKLEEVALERRLLRQPQALPERRLLLGPDLPGDGLPDGDVHRAVRHPPRRRAGWPTGIEMLEQNRRIARPRQLYVGAEVRDYIPVESR